MYKTLPVVLLLAGILLIGYGIYDIFTPQSEAETIPLEVKAKRDQTESYAMLGLGILSLIAGMAYGKR